jgi:hypothetical protein
MDYQIDFFVVLWVELALARQVLYHEPSPHAFCCNYFWNRVSKFSWADMGFDSPIHASEGVGMTGTCHYTQLLVEMDFLNFLPRLVLNHDPINLCHTNS